MHSFHQTHAHKQTAIASVFSPLPFITIQNEQVSVSVTAGARFESRSSRKLTCLWLFVVLQCPSRQLSGFSFDKSEVDPFQIIWNS
jgi:hypothetical protein